MNRISTESLGDQSTVRGSKRDSMNLSPMSANSEASGSTFIPPKELMVRDKSVRLSQTTVSSQSSGNKKEGALENWKTWAKEIEDRAGRTDSSSSPVCCFFSTLSYFFGVSLLIHFILFHLA